MVGLERSTLPLIGETEFGLGSSAAVLSFIVAFGLAKSFTNLGRGPRCAGRSQAPADPGLDPCSAGAVARRGCTELDLDRDRQRLPRREPGTGVVDDGGNEDRLGGAQTSGLALGQNESAATERRSPRPSAVGSRASSSLATCWSLVGGGGSRRLDLAPPRPRHYLPRRPRAGSRSRSGARPLLNADRLSGLTATDSRRALFVAGLVNNLNDAPGLGAGTAFLAAEGAAWGRSAWSPGFTPRSG